MIHPNYDIRHSLFVVRYCFRILLVLGVWLPSAAATEKPNIVFILIDDMGWRDLGCYGSDLHQTPHIDCLAGEGVRFTDAYSAGPVCSPSRASLLTGKYPARLHLTAHIRPGNRDHPDGKLKVPFSKYWLEPDEVTLAEALKAHGYRTAMIGKWHLGEQSGPAYRPDKQGFDEVVLSQFHGYFNYFHPFVDAENCPWAGPLPGKPGDYLPDNLTDAANRFIEANRERPFFLFLSHWSVHYAHCLVENLDSFSDELRWPAKPEMIEKYRGLIDKSKLHNNPRYAAMVESVDESVGRVRAQLERLGLLEDTIIVVGSDNGGCSLSASLKPLRGEKACIYEGGIRVPLIVRWPKRIREGQDCAEPVLLTDLYPTLLDLAGLPLRPDQHLDVVSLAPLLTGEGGVGRKELFWHYPHYLMKGITEPASAIRRGNYKLLEFFEDGRLELYDLANDVGEARNLAEEKPELTKQLHQSLIDWRRQVGAPMPARKEGEPGAQPAVGRK
jgi:arylsulfatase A-like enzyme